MEVKAKATKISQSYKFFSANLKKKTFRRKRELLLQHHMQRELVAPQLSLIIRGGDLQDAGHPAGGIDSRLHRCADGLLRDAVDHYLKDGGDILGQGADTVLTE